MTLNYMQINSLIEVITELQDTKMPFKLSLILAKNLNALKKEEDFYNEEKQTFVQSTPGVFAIKEGLEEECRTAREELNAFSTELELRTIPIDLIDNMEFTPKQIAALELILAEEE